eukprot:2779755-Pleurochrysis_carterae.AAC.2
MAYTTRAWDKERSSFAGQSVLMHDTKLTDCRQIFQVLPISSVRERAPYSMITIEHKLSFSPNGNYSTSSLSQRFIAALHCALLASMHVRYCSPGAHCINHVLHVRMRTWGSGFGELIEFRRRGGP